MVLRLYLNSSICDNKIILRVLKNERSANSIIGRVKTDILSLLIFLNSKTFQVEKMENQDVRRAEVISQFGF